MLTQFEGILARPRLLSRLTVGHRRSVIAIHAPPGYGKTILARQYVDGLAHPVVWHALHPDEQDVTNLYHAALRHLPAGTVAAATDLPSAYERSPIELARDITTRLSEAFGESPFTYVLDDWQHAASPDGDAWLWTLVESWPTTGQILILSRTRPSLDYVQLLARNAIVRVNQAELRFTPDEVAQLAALHSADPMTLAADLASLEGWPVGVILALRQGGQLMLAPALDVTQDATALFAQLADDLIHTLDLDLQTFLLASSTLEALTPAGCRDGLGLPAVAAALDRLRQLNLFVTETPDGLVYHALFRQHLQATARAQDETQFLARHRQAAVWYVVQGQMARAFTHYLAAQDTTAAAALADDLAPLYFSQGKFETLLTWERALATRAMVAPYLTYECTIIHYNRLDYEQSLAGLEAAAVVFSTRDDRVGLALVDIQRAWIACQSGAAQDALDQVTPLLSFSDSAVRGQALRLAGVACQRLMRYEDSIRYFRQAERLFRQLDLKSSLSHLLQDLGGVYTFLGLLEETGACLQEVVALRRQLGGRGALALALNNLGYHYHQHSDYARARTTFREGLSLAAQVDDRRAQVYLHWSIGDLERDLEDWDQAATHYHQGLRLSATESEPGVVASLYISLSTLFRRQGQLDQAQVTAHQALAVSLDASFETLRARAAVYLADADPHAVSSWSVVLDPLIDTLEERGEHFERSGLLTACAGLAAQAGDAEAVQSYMRLAVQAAAACQAGQAVVTEWAASPALRRVWHAQSAPPPVAEAWRAWAAATDARTATVRSMGSPSTFSLQIQTFGDLRIERNGALLLPSAWQSRLALEIFLYLVVQGPHTKETLGLIFWPDSDKSQLHSQFHTELNRARHAIGKETILFAQGRYRLNPVVTLDLDFVVFEDTIRQARLMPDSKARAEDLWQAALGHYRGPFLAELDYSWVLPLRERFEAQALEAHHHLATLALARRAPEEALDHWQAGLRMDPYREEFHRAIMRVHAARGESARVVEQYHTLSHTLQEMLGIEPSHETQLLYRQLLQS